MKLAFQSTGGFLGLRLSYHIESDDLPKEKATRLIRLVEESRFFEVSQYGLSKVEMNRLPDVINYSLSITKDGTSNTLHFNDVTMPEKLQPLVSYIRDLAMDQSKNN
ncbi:hypothetical protein EHV15_26330 [Paenibacillus oralis]|uniref:Uncharacterized protein n=1 Tax=Paenibacillus oralis TaxID=2490856 RepID=A0A3P3U8V6_9BACL|nr:protealysin inhibitor emfourin [Paenibacillus oralis]RRJ66038.1 hypothetical protein EHV15_26330 [Paenibacillus oralis]